MARSCGSSRPGPAGASILACYVPRAMTGTAASLGNLNRLREIFAQDTWSYKKLTLNVGV